MVVNGSGFDRSAKVQYFVSGTTNPGGIMVRGVTYRSSTELVTTIEVADDGRAVEFRHPGDAEQRSQGQGHDVVLGQGQAERPESAAASADVPGGQRTGTPSRRNGGTTAATSRLYMFGGAGGAQLEWQDLDDLWVYTGAGSSGAKWTFVSPGSTAPGPRHHVAWSCGGGYCVLSNGVPYYDEAWVFSESSASWSQLACTRRAPCPTQRYMAAMAYDPAAGRHVLFGGAYNWSLGDTWSFSTSTMKWTNHGSASTVAARNWAAATFVPPMAHVVLFGGFDGSSHVFDDMYFWDGSKWVAVLQVVDGTVTGVPPLMNHSMAWDPVGNRLIVTGGLKDNNDTPSNETFYVTFSSQGGGWRAAWTKASGIGCQSTAGSSDATVHPQARMAFDIPSGVQVVFGGVENLPGIGAYAYDNTVECY